MEKGFVEVKVKLPEKIYQALTWYVKHTVYWIDNEHEEKTISSYLADIAEEWLKMEANNPEDAIECIKKELATQLDLKETEA